MLWQQGESQGSQAQYGNSLAAWAVQMEAALRSEQLQYWLQVGSVVAVGVVRMQRAPVPRHHAQGN